MKKVIIPLLFPAFLTGCKKELGPLLSPVSELMKTETVKSAGGITTGILLKTCINSIQDMKRVLGASSFNITGVVLENEQTILVGGSLHSVFYSAEYEVAVQSNFRSKLVVTYNLNGIFPQYISEVWSLGCPAKSSATLGVFTNLRRGNMIYTINTCFIWNDSPHATRGLRVKYLLL